MREKISFIKQGKFVEVKDKPTLRLVGGIKEISTGKIIVHETTKKIEFHILNKERENHDLFEKNISFKTM